MFAKCDLIYPIGAGGSLMSAYTCFLHSLRSNKTAAMAKVETGNVTRRAASTAVEQTSRESDTSSKCNNTADHEEKECWFLAGYNAGIKGEG